MSKVKQSAVTMSKETKATLNRRFNSVSSHQIKPAKCHPNVTGTAELLRMMIGDGPCCIPVSGGHFAIVDVDDYERCIGRKWRAIYGGDNVYAESRGVLLHRFILGASKGQQVDHKNCQGLDCRKDNLRLATPTQQRANSRKIKPAKSRYKGVTRTWSGNWSARICSTTNGKQTATHLGVFKSQEEAARAYDCEALKRFGEFARLNFPQSQAA